MKKFSGFYEDSRLIDMFSRTGHFFLFSATLIQFVSPRPICLRSILLLLSHLRLGILGGSFPAGITTRTLKEFLFCYRCATCCYNRVALKYIRNRVV
jgi:hypothetical protein